MLRITIHNNPGSVTFQLEGRLAGLWVRELENCWQSVLTSQRKPVLRFDLTGVTYIDAAGKEFLAARHTDGAEFLACGCQMKAVVAELANAAAPNVGRPEGGSQISPS
jgi:hypothetical protein